MAEASLRGPTLNNIASAGVRSASPQLALETKIEAFVALENKL